MLGISFLATVKRLCDYKEQNLRLRQELALERQKVEKGPNNTHTLQCTYLHYNTHTLHYTLHIHFSVQDAVLKEAVRSNVPEAKFGLLSRVPAWDIDVEVCIDEGVERTVWIYYNLQPIKKGKISESFFLIQKPFRHKEKTFDEFYPLIMITE